MHVKSRPIPLVKRSDLVCRSIRFREQLHWMIKDPVALQYHQLTSEQYSVLQQLDGQATLESLRATTQGEFPLLEIDHFSIQSLVIDLHQKGLVASSRAGQGDALISQRLERKRKNLIRAAMSPFFVRLPGFNPRGILRFVNSLFGWIFRRTTVVAGCGLILFALVIIAVNARELRLQVGEFQRFFTWPNLVYLWLTVGFAKFAHELGHGVACQRFGGECNSIGLAFLVFSPTLYCDATDSWMFRSKWARIAVASAGMYVEVLLASAAIILWNLLQDGLFRHLCLNLFLVSTVTTVIFNANPLIRFDGYYILSDLLEIPNLREKSSRLLQRFLAWCLGADLPRDDSLPQTGRVWFVLFALGSAMYRLLIISGIFSVLMTALVPYRLQSVGVTWAFVSATLLLTGFLRMLISSYKFKTGQQRNRRRLFGTVACLLVITSLITLIPVPISVSAPFLIRPLHSDTIYVDEPGRLEAVYTTPGERVTAGDPLVLLSNPDLELKVLELNHQIKANEQNQRSAEVSNEVVELVSLQSERRKLLEQRRELVERQQNLTIRSPGDGAIVAARRVTEMPLEAKKDRLSSWTSTPLAKSNLGAWLDVATPVATVATTDEYRAELLVPQSMLRDMFIGQSIRLSLDGAPWRIYTGKIETMSLRNSLRTPSELSGMHGGSVATTPSSSGSERPSESSYSVTVRLTDLARPVSGLRGRARILVSEYTLGHWIWRKLRMLFRYQI